MTTPRPGLANTVPHALNCLCRDCCAARAAEVRRRLEEQRRERRLSDLVMAEEVAGRGVVFARLGKPMPGTVTAINARYGKVGS
jgi:hypothetical protein